MVMYLLNRLEVSISPAKSKSQESLSEASLQLALDRVHRACEATKRGFLPLACDDFDAAHEAYERSSNQQHEVHANLGTLLAESSHPGQPMRVLSVGPGNGMLDLSLIQSLAGAGIATEYTGVDPNPVACRRFREGFDALNPRGVSFSLVQSGVDDLHCGSAFDVIHAVHSLYYVPDPPATLDRLLGLLVAGGRLVIYKAPHGALNALAELFWRSDRKPPIWFSEQLGAWLVETRREFEKHRINAWLDVTDVFKRDDVRGRLILDFLLHTASGNLETAVKSAVLECLRTISRFEAGRWLAPHPVDAFVISTA